MRVSTERSSEVVWLGINPTYLNFVDLSCFDERTTKLGVFIFVVIGRELGSAVSGNFNVDANNSDTAYNSSEV